MRPLQQLVTLPPSERREELPHSPAAHLPDMKLQRIRLWCLLGLSCGLAARFAVPMTAWAAGGARFTGRQTTASPGSAPARHLLSTRRLPSCQAMRHKWAKRGWCEFWAPSAPRGTTKRGKKDHFHLLDRYIRRIDALVPEDMEDLVRPLSYKPNQERTTRTLKISLDPEAANVTEDDVRAFLEPLVPSGLALGWVGLDGEPEVYVQFETNEECQLGRKHDGEPLGGSPARVRYSVDNKFRRVCEDLANGINQITMPEQPQDDDMMLWEDSQEFLSGSEQVGLLTEQAKTPAQVQPS